MDMYLIYLNFCSRRGVECVGGRVKMTLLFQRSVVNFAGPQGVDLSNGPESQRHEFGCYLLSD